MNFYIIAGILLFSLGAGMILYSFSIIVGILLNALGTGMIVYGQHVKSKVESSEMSRAFQDKVDNVLKHIDEVRVGANDEASAGKVQQIEQEFKDWASEFLKNREIRKVEFARTELNSVDAQLKVSNEWSRIFGYVLKTIESLANAYSAESGETIKVNFPPLPPNLYSKQARKYDGNVVFPNEVVWQIKFSSSDPPKKEQPPSMLIGFRKEGDQYFYDSFLRISSFWKDSFTVSLEGPNVPTSEGIEGLYPLDSYLDKLKTIMRLLFEAQLLRD